MSLAVYVYHGTEVPIHRSIKYLFTFTCEYNLYAFPFDMQECSIQLTLSSSPGCRPFWSIEEEGILVEGNDTSVSMYEISHIRFQYNKSSRYNNEVSVKMLFTRKFIGYLLTTFLPCAILYTLSEFTLILFRLDGFTDRITVTLSLLIVIASLFSQVTSNVPSSPTPKAVDIFFFYCIMRVSFVFFLHSLIDQKVRSRERGKEEILALTQDPGKKAAWMQKPRKGCWKSDYNVPKIINNCGMTFLVITDIFLYGLMIGWIAADHNDKYGRFLNLNMSRVLN